MMKKATAMLVFLFSVYTLLSQDTITKKNGEVISVKVMEVNQTEVKFKREDDLNGPLYVIPKSDVEIIQFKNAGNDIFNQNEGSKTKSNLHDSLYFKGQIDAFKFYRSFHDAAMLTLISSLASPLGGLVPAIICTETPPKQKNLSCPNIELLTGNVSYYRGYTERARKIKNSKVWKSWGVGLGVNVGVVIIIALSNR